MNRKQPVNCRNRTGVWRPALATDTLDGMYGYLVPSSGGQAIPLRKTRLYLGRVKGSDAPLSRENAFCQLELIDGFWMVEDLHTPGGVKINGRACKRERLMPDDEIVLGAHRYRITFAAPKYAGVGKLAKSSSAKSIDEATTVADQRVLPPGTASKRPRGVLAHLVPTGGGPDIPLIKPRVTIGRKPPCDVVLEYRSISAMHCGLELLDGYWRAQDLGSRNGIRVGGVAVTKAWVLPKGRLALAEHRFVLDYVGEGEPPEEAAASTAEQEPASSKRSLIDKLGLSEQDLEETVAEHKSEATDRRQRWNVMDNR